MRDESRAVWVADTASDRDLAHAPSLQRGPTRAVLCAPIRSAGVLIGALYASGPTFDAQALELLSLYAGQAVSLLAAAERDRALVARLAEAKGEAPSTTSLIGSSPAMRALDATLRKIATRDIPVLVGGETGTGKELVARELHRRSPRAKGPFVPVHCGAIPAELVGSELFGHVRGAFTSAQNDRLGFIRAAEGGTLFLDEIGEMPLAQQVALLRVLQDRKVVPVGGERAFPVDFRLVAATNRDLEREVAAGRFRQDLYFRVAGVTVVLPPLRDREGDAALLASHFLAAHRAALGRPDVRLSAAALTAIRLARWEGNVRELEAAVRKAIVLCDDETITPADLGLAAPPSSPDAILPLSLVRDEYSKKYVREVVERLGGNRTAAAEALMVSVRTVFKYLEEVLRPSGPALPLSPSPPALPLSPSPPAPLPERERGGIVCGACELRSHSWTRFPSPKLGEGPGVRATRVERVAGRTRQPFADPTTPPGN
jgi:DNA-binding NtrC family response regulator